MGSQKQAVKAPVRTAQPPLLVVLTLWSGGAGQQPDGLQASAGGGVVESGGAGVILSCQTFRVFLDEVSQTCHAPSVRPLISGGGGGGHNIISA